MRSILVDFSKQMEDVLRTFFLHAVCTVLLMALPIALETVNAQGHYLTEVSTELFLSDDADNNETEIYAFRGRQHFSPVDASGHPLKEAAFLERIGDIELTFAMTDLRFGSGLAADGPFYGGSVHYMQPGLPFLLITGFQRSRVAFDSPISANITTNLYDLAFGIFLKDGLLIQFGYTHSKTVLSQTSFPSVEFEGDNYDFITKWVYEIDNKTAFNIEGTIGAHQFKDSTSKGSNTVFAILGEYYFNPRMSLGSGYAFNTGDDKDDEGSTATLIATVFINPSFSAQLEFETFFADNIEGEDEDHFDLLLSVRF